jgi:nitroreductase
MERRKSLKVGAALLSGLMLAPGVKGSTLPSSIETESFWDVIKGRRSVRKFKPDPIPEEHLMKIMDAARLAPTSGNQQPWKFILVQSEKQIEKLKSECFSSLESYYRDEANLEGEKLSEAMEETKKRYSEGYFTAPAYIVVLTDQECKYPSYTPHDGPLAAGYLMLAARALGYGSVYITDAIPEEVTQKAFNIPEKYNRVCITPIGVPVEWPTKEKEAFETFLVRETFS